MSKIRYPKCPYCKKEFKERGLFDIDVQNLTKLVTIGGLTDVEIRCPHCNEDYKVTVKIMYYGGKR